MTIEPTNKYNYRSMGIQWPEETRINITRGFYQDVYTILIRI